MNTGVYDAQPGTTSSAPQADLATAVNAELQMLSSAELHRAVAREELGAGATGEQLSRRVKEIDSHLHVSKVESANVLQLEYSDRDPEHAAQILRHLLNAYFRQRADVLTGDRTSLLTQQRNSVGAQLDKANAALADYEKQNGVVDITEQINGAVALDNRLHQATGEAEANLEDSRKAVSVLRQNAGSAPQADAAAAKATSDSYHDAVQDRLIQGEAALAGAQARRAVLGRQVAASAERLKALILVSNTLTRLRTQRDLLADTLKTYVGQLEQVRVQQDQAIAEGSTSVRILEAPVAPARRSNPPLPLIAVSLLAGALVATFAVIVLSSIRDTFLSPQEAERALRMPVLCELPAASGDLEPRLFGRLIASIAGLGLAGGGRVVLLLTPGSQPAQDNAAHGLSAALHRRAPGRVALLRFNNQGGPVEEAMSNTLDPNGLTLLSVPITLERRYLVKLFAGLRSQFDSVIVTAPPSGVAFESFDIVPFADIALLVLEAERTRRAVAEELLIGNPKRGLPTHRPCLYRQAQPRSGRARESGAEPAACGCVGEQLKRRSVASLRLRCGAPVAFAISAWSRGNPALLVTRRLH